MVETVAPALLAFFPLFLLAATVFFEAEAKRQQEDGTITSAIFLGVSFIVVMPSLLFASIFPLTAMVTSSAASAWGDFFTVGVSIGLIGIGAYLVVTMFATLMRLYSRVQVLRGARRVRRMAEGTCRTGGASGLLTRLTRGVAMTVVVSVLMLAGLVVVVYCVPGVLRS